tara:strand:- start:248 stop:718 length:471 start_codon:yes stop_codon:yes gene_type:complete
MIDLESENFIISPIIPLIVFLFLFSLLLSGCIKAESIYSDKKFGFFEENISTCQINSKECFKNFPEIKGPFSFEEKSKASLIMGKYFCLSKKRNFEQNLKKIVTDEFIENNININLINSYEVTKTANRISNLIVDSCDITEIKNENLQFLIKEEFK